MRYVLAPLAGFTDAAFRRLCFEGGADFAYTEMVSAAGLAHGSSPTRQLMETMPGEGALGCQIFGANESDVAYAAGAVPDRFSEINLNAGCPVRKVVKEGAGAKLAEDPEKVYRLLRAMKEHTALPVTLKTRLGPRPDRNLSLELLDAAERAGAAGVVFHARFTSQMHGGATHLDLLAEIAARAKVPVTGNGSVGTRSSSPGSRGTSRRRSRRRRSAHGTSGTCSTSATASPPRIRTTTCRRRIRSPRSRCTPTSSATSTGDRARRNCVRGSIPSVRSRRYMI